MNEILPVAQTPPAPPAAWRKPSIVFVLITLGLDAFGIGVVIPVIPGLVRLLSHRPISEASIWVGGMVSAFAFAQFLAAPIIGGLSDRFGRRPVILASISGVCVNYLLLAFAPTLGWILAGRILAGATSANVSAANAYIADVTPPELRAQRFGLIGAMFGLGFVLGPAIGGFVGQYSLRGPFILSAGLAFCNALYGVFVLPESLRPELRRPFSWRRTNPVGTVGMLGRDGFVARLAGAWSCLWFGISVMQSVFVLYATLRFGWGPELNGAALAAVGVCQTVVQGFLVRRIVTRLGDKRTALVGCLFFVSAFLAFAFVPFGWMLFPAMLLQALGTMAIPPIRSLLSARVGPTRQGEISGALSSVEGLTQIASPLAAAGLFGMFSAAHAVVHFPGAPFLLGAAIYAGAFFFVRSAHKRVLASD